MNSENTSDNRRPPHSFAQRFIHGNILGNFWGTLVTGIGFLTSYVTVAALSVYQYGLYQLVLSVVVLGNTFTINIFDDVVVNDISRAFSEDRKPEAKRMFFELAALKIGAAVLITAVLFLGAHIISLRYGKDIASYVQIVSLLFIVRAVRSIAGLFLSSIVSLRAMGSNALEEGFKFVAIMGFYFFAKLGIREVLISTVLGAAAGAIYTVIPFLQEYSVRLAGIRPVREFLFKARVLKQYGFWVILRYALGKATNPIRPWLIRLFINTEAVALYSVASSLITILKKAIPIPGSQLIAWEVPNQKRFRYIFIRGLKYAILIGLIIGAAGLAVPLLVHAVIPKYAPAMPLFMLLLLSVPIYTVSTFEFSFLTALREQKLLATRVVIETIAFFAIQVLLLPVVGIFAQGIEVVVVTLWRVIFLYRKMTKKYPELAAHPRDLFVFDAEDKVLFWRGVQEVKTFMQKYSRGFLFADN